MPKIISIYLSLYSYICLYLCILKTLNFQVRTHDSCVWLLLFFHRSARESYENVAIGYVEINHKEFAQLNVKYAQSIKLGPRHIM